MGKNTRPEMMAADRTIEPEEVEPTAFDLVTAAVGDEQIERVEVDGEEIAWFPTPGVTGLPGYLRFDTSVDQVGDFAVWTPTRIITPAAGGVLSATDRF